MTIQTATKNWVKTTIRDLEAQGKLELGRGQIISQKNIEAIPGEYPVYSSSARGNGEFGRYGKYMFDEELVTWSVDGGGKFFYRPKSKYSITNVSGFLRVVDKSELDTYFVWASLYHSWLSMTFNYNEKLHPSILRERFSISYPMLSEQKSIAQTLTTVQDAIAVQEALIAKLKELKRSMMQHLFTHGTKGEKTRMTEVGEIPESWGVVSVDSLKREEMRNGAFVRRHQFGSGFLFANVVDMYGDLQLSYKNLDRVNISEKDYERFALKDGDILFVRSSLKREGVAQCSVIRNLPEEATFDCHLINLRVDTTLAVPEFVANYWRSGPGKRELVQRSKTTTMTTINQDGLGAALMPLPSVDEQNKITNILYSLDNRISAVEIKSAYMKELFKTLLHELMSGERRINI